MSKRVAALFSAVTITLVAGVGVAIAAGFDGTNGQGTINACFAKTGGALRVINVPGGQKCRATETPLNWQQNGGLLELGTLDANSAVSEPAALVEASGQVDPGHGDAIVVAQATLTMPKAGFAEIYFTQAASNDGNVSCDGATQYVSTDAGLVIDGVAPGEVGSVSDPGATVQGQLFFPEELWLTAGSHTVTMNVFPTACNQSASGAISLTYHAHFFYIP